MNPKNRIDFYQELMKEIDIFIQGLQQKFAAYDAQDTQAGRAGPDEWEIQKRKAREQLDAKLHDIISQSLQDLYGGKYSNNEIPLSRNSHISLKR